MLACIKAFQNDDDDDDEGMTMLRYEGRKNGTTKKI